MIYSGYKYGKHAKNCSNCKITHFSNLKWKLRGLYYCKKCNEKLRWQKRRICLCSKLNDGKNIKKPMKDYSYIGNVNCLKCKGFGFYFK